MSGPSRRPEGRAAFFVEQTWLFGVEHDKRADAEFRKALLASPRLTPEALAARYDHYARACLAGRAAQLLPYVCEHSQFDFFVQCLDERRRWLLDEHLPVVVAYVLADYGKNRADCFATRCRILIDAEFEEWQAKGLRNVYEYNRYREGSPLPPLVPSLGQSELDELRQPIMEYHKTRFAVPPRSLNGSSPAPSGEQPINAVICSPHHPTGEHPNKTFIKQKKQEYKQLVGASLTYKAISAEAGYESESWTQLKRWMSGGPGCGKADAKIRAALERLIPNTPPAIEAEKVRRKLPISKKT